MFARMSASSAGCSPARRAWSDTSLRFFAAAVLYKNRSPSLPVSTSGWASVRCEGDAVTATVPLGPDNFLRRSQDCDLASVAQADGHAIPTLKSNGKGEIKPTGLTRIARVRMREVKTVAWAAVQC